MLKRTTHAIALAAGVAIGGSVYTGHASAVEKPGWPIYSCNKLANPLKTSDLQHSLEADAILIPARPIVQMFFQDAQISAPYNGMWLICRPDGNRLMQTAPN